MPVVLVIVAVLATLLLWAIYSEHVPPEPEPALLPRWTDLPSAEDIRRTDFPLVAVGYDRAAVRAHLDRVAAAYDVMRMAHDHVTREDDPPPSQDPAGDEEVPTPASMPPPPPPPAPDGEDLRDEA